MYIYRGVASGSTQIPGLLYADDTSLFGEDAKTLRQSLYVLEDWCQEWDMRVNVEKSALIIHFRDRSCEQCQDKFVVNGEVIPLVSSYRYLGCCVNEFLDLKDMVVDRVEAGRRAANLLLQRVRTSVGMLSG